MKEEFIISWADCCQSHAGLVLLLAFPMLFPVRWGLMGWYRTGHGILGLFLGLG